MADSHVEDLRYALSRQLLNAEPNPGGRLPEEQTVSRLVNTVQEADIGNISAPRLRRIFENNPVPGFDYREWMQTQIEAGVYPERVLTDDDEWELETE